jgi:hypothetical protein
MTDKLERLRSLVARAVHPKTLEEEARTSAMLACRLIVELKLLDEPVRRSVRYPQASRPVPSKDEHSELDLSIMLRLGPDRGDGRRRMHVLFTSSEMFKVAMCNTDIPQAGVLEAKGEPGWGPKMEVRIPYWAAENRAAVQYRLRSVCFEASGPWSYAQWCQTCWTTWCDAHDL